MTRNDQRNGRGLSAYSLRSWLLRFYRSEFRMRLDVVEIAVVVQQWQIVLDGDGGNHTVDGFTDGDPLLSQGSIELGSSHKCRMAHRQEDERFKVILRFPIIGVGPDALEHFR